LEGNELFPVFIKLNTLHTLLVGAGPVGLEKLTALLNNSPTARITIVALDIIPEIRAIANVTSNIVIKEKAFCEEDLDDVELVIAATNNDPLNQQIKVVAKKKKLLVNFADKPALCDFYLGSIVKKGDLKIAISTNGKSPTIAKRLKEILNESLPQELNTTLQQMSELRNRLEGDFTVKVRKLNQVTSILVEDQPGSAMRVSFKWLVWSTIILSLAVILAVFWYKEPAFQSFLTSINPVFYWFLIGGFVFAMVDGAIGMSYGVTSTSFSLAMGIPPASASMAVHFSEILSNGIAGWMHYRMGNINWKLFRLLILPGVLGAVAGAFLLSSLEAYSAYIKPLISVYTLILGGVILSKAIEIKRFKSSAKIKKIPLLGLFGGFIDAVGGGGWGSIVLSNLIAGGRNARFSLGTVKITRFFIASMSSLAFLTMLTGAHWEAVCGLVIGSALAAPLAAKVSNKISAKNIMIAVGIIVILVSLRSIVYFILQII